MPERIKPVTRQSRPDYGRGFQVEFLKTVGFCSTEGVGLLGETLLGEAIRGKLTFFSDLLGGLEFRMKGVGCDVQGSRFRV